MASSSPRRRSPRLAAAPGVEAGSSSASRPASKPRGRGGATRAGGPPAGMSRGALLFRLARPKFLIYSAACHALGVLWVAVQEQQPDSPWISASRSSVPWAGVDLTLCVLLQLTIWVTHVATHFVNEFGDAEVDALNQNAGSWTGGSKVLALGWLPKWVAAACGAGALATSVSLGVATVWRYLTVHRSALAVAALDAWQTAPSATSGAASFFSTALASPDFPWGFVVLGLSVLAVAVAYSLPPLHLSANSLGEVSVSYVLTFATPLTGVLMQDGVLSTGLVQLLAPLFVVNAARMLIMNLPDRAGDAAGQKVTSVVLIGEERTVQLHNFLTAAVYLVMVPQLPLLSPVQRVAYFVPLPLRWWQSLRLNSPGWWTRKDALADSIPFVESLYVLTSVCSLCGGLAYELWVEQQ